MRFRVDQEIAWPRDVVYATQRDRASRLAAYLSRVDRVEELSAGDGVLRRWWLDAGQLPGVLAGAVPPDALSIDERVAWDQARFRAAVRIVPTRWPDALAVTGDLRFHDDDDHGTLLEFEGDLTIGRLPSILADLGEERVAGLLIGMVRPRFVEICRATDALLHDES